jgi:hypothetical protein
MVILITVVLVVIVTDFESVTNGFANFVDVVSALLGRGR